MAETLAIEAIGLIRRFGPVQAVRGLNLAIRSGEIFGLIGPDGAGKTTTLRLLAAVMLPTAGQVRIMGQDTRRQAEAIRRAIGYMPQKFSLYGDLTVAENLGFFADIFGVRGPARRQRIEEALAFAHLAEFRGRRAAHLSGGMQKKLALACTLVHTPQVIFLDEPTTGVDPISRREFWDILTALHVQGVTLLISTPYMDEAERCSRVGLMYEGEIIRCDRPEVLRTLVPGEMLAVRTTPLAAAQEILERVPGVLEVQTYGDRLHLFVESATALQPVIRERLAAAGLPASDIRDGTPRVEEAFISLIRQRQAGAGGTSGTASLS
ncbi:MAG TPA: ABC transporter ATP-binding protein [Anaerolineae bacterium]